MSLRDRDFGVEVKIGIWEVRSGEMACWVCGFVFLGVRLRGSR